MKWKVTLINIAQGKLPLGEKVRHNLSYVYVSKILEQYYCELKVENRYREKEIRIIEKEKNGIDLHDVILGIQRISCEDLISRIESLQNYTTSFPLLAKYGNIVIAGKPDAITFVHGKPRFVIELKTTQGSSLGIWKDQIIQAGIYAFLLEEMGFDCSALQLIVSKIKHDPCERVEHKRKLIDPIVSVLLQGRIRDLERIYLGNIHCEYCSYSRNVILKEIDWALDHWLSERQPLTTANPKKWLSCEFRNTCIESDK